MTIIPQPISRCAIIADERAQSRAGRDEAAVAEYAEAVAAGAKFPPLVVFQDGERFWLAEGFHRLEAYTAAGVDEVPCEVRQGKLRDAILHSAGANADHGLRRTNEDKRRAVLMLLRDQEWGKWNDSKVARACAVSHPFVATVRSAYLETFQDSPRLVERGGTVYPMKPRQRPAEPAPAEPAPSVPAEAEPAELPPAPEAMPPVPASNVLELGPRLKIIPSPEQIERGLVAEEAAAEIETMEDFDASRVDHRANAVNYCLGLLEHVPLTGREYWNVYGKSPKRELFIRWARIAKATLDDIVKEHDRVGKT